MYFSFLSERRERRRPPAERSALYTLRVCKSAAHSLSQCLRPVYRSGARLPRLVGMNKSDRRRARAAFFAGRNKCRATSSRTVRLRTNGQFVSVLSAQHAQPIHRAHATTTVASCQFAFVPREQHARINACTGHINRQLVRDRAE